ncbi:MAG TPA: response regulator [Longimicrobiales bacterium]|nr:response regulator [Longimicrobiales bacterium]
MLVVDDNTPLRRSMRRILEGEGYSVLEAMDATEAVALCEASARPVDLLITDLNMPGIDGFDLGRQFLERRFADRIIVVSGDSDRARDDERAAIAVAILPKPFDASSLTGLVRAALDGPPAR